MEVLLGRYAPNNQEQFKIRSLEILSSPGNFEIEVLNH
jgi:hypothetical protein